MSKFFKDWLYHMWVITWIMMIFFITIGIAVIPIILVLSFHNTWYILLYVPLIALVASLPTSED